MNALKARRMIYSFLAEKTQEGLNSVFGDEIADAAANDKRLANTLTKAQSDVRAKMLGLSKGLLP